MLCCYLANRHTTNPLFSITRSIETIRHSCFLRLSLGENIHIPLPRLLLRAPRLRPRRAQQIINATSIAHARRRPARRPRRRRSVARAAYHTRRRRAHGRQRATGTGAGCVERRHARVPKVWHARARHQPLRHRRRRAGTSRAWRGRARRRSGCRTGRGRCGFLGGVVLWRRVLVDPALELRVEYEATLLAQVGTDRLAGRACTGSTVLGHLLGLGGAAAAAAAAATSPETSEPTFACLGCLFGFSAFSYRLVSCFGD
jgi:hypothetical protein